MIAALSCALLCGVVPAFPTQALQCEDGQANVSLYRDHVSYDGHTETYHVRGLGRSSIDFSDVPEAVDKDEIILYLETGPFVVRLPYVEKEISDPSLLFGSWYDPQHLAITVPSYIHRIYPAVNFVDGRRLVWDFHFDLVSTIPFTKGKPTLSSIRVYAQGIGNDGKLLKLFDTRNPCKE